MIKKAPKKPVSKLKPEEIISLEAYRAKESDPNGRAPSTEKIPEGLKRFGEKFAEALAALKRSRQNH